MLNRLILICCLGFPSFCLGILHDTCAKQFAGPKKIRIIDARIDFFTTLSKINSQGNSELTSNLLHFYYNFTLINKTPLGKWKINNYFFNEFGLRHFNDSSQSISEDQYVLRNSLMYPVKAKKIIFTLSHTNRSQFWPHYTYSKNAIGAIEKIRFTNFLSPGYTLFSGGFQLQIGPRCSFELGVLGGKVVKVKDQHLFESRRVKMLYGLAPGEKRKVSYGFTFTGTIVMLKIYKNIYWEQLSQVFIQHRVILQPEKYGVEVNNALHFLFLKYVRLTARTQFGMDRELTPGYQLTQHISLGFYLNNKLSDQ